MEELIKIDRTDHGRNVVSARELHAFLEVGRDFSNWIKDRIAQYGFVEDQDFKVFANSGENLRGGRPTKEYSITLDMAKELSMVERNERGKIARQYFIACEKKLREVVGKTVPEKISGAAQVFEAGLRIATLIGCDRNASAISANQLALRHTGVDLLGDMGQTHLLAGDQGTLWHTPTELGLMLGGVPARDVNLMLAGAGFQARTPDGRWAPLEAHGGLFRIFDVGKKQGSGVPVQQVKWSAKVLEKMFPERGA